LIAAGGNDFHLIDAEAVLQTPSLGRRALADLVEARSREGRAIEICTGNGGGLVVLGRLAKPMTVRYWFDATPGR